MFDYIKSEVTLPELPEAVVKLHGNSFEDVVFQTKDTPNQSMDSYKISVNGQLQVHKIEGEYGPDKEVAEDASWIDKLSSRGEFTVLREWWEDVFHTGEIRFYDYYKHTDDKNVFPYEYEGGWIEYIATFLKGSLVGDIAIVDSKEPRKYSQQEMDDRAVEVKQNREKMDEMLKKSRKDNPSIEQKLIDSLFDAECVESVRAQIIEYREKYDTYYEK